MNLEELKTGDKVIYIGGRGAYSYELIKEVSRVTKTQIVTTDGKRFRKTDGTAIGGNSSFSVNKIRVLTEEEK